MYGWPALSHWPAWALAAISMARSRFAMGFVFSGELRPLRGSSTCCQEAIDLDQVGELKPAQMRELSRVAQLGELLPALIVRGDGPPDDGLPGEMRSHKRLSVAVPEHLAKQHPPHASQDDSAQHDGKAEVEPDDGAGPPPQLAPGGAVIARNHPTLLGARPSDERQKPFYRLGPPVRAPEQFVKLDERAAELRGEESARGRLPRTTRPDDHQAAQLMRGAGGQGAVV